MTPLLRKNDNELMTTPTRRISSFVFTVLCLNKSLLLEIKVNNLCFFIQIYRSRLPSNRLLTFNNTVESPLTATPLQRPLFFVLADKKIHTITLV